MIGLFTRIVAFILSGEMAFAYFIGHMFKDPAKPVFLPLLNGGTARDPVLLRLSLSGDRGRRAVQRRRDAEEVTVSPRCEHAGIQLPGRMRSRRNPE